MFKALNAHALRNGLVLLTVLTVGCGAAPDSNEAPSAADEAAFTLGAISRLEGTFFSQEEDTRPPVVLDARCWRSPLPAGVVCANPPLPKTNLGTGSVTVRVRQHTTGSDRALADVRVSHPSFDGTQTVVRTFGSLELQLSDGGYGPGDSWSGRVTSQGLTYRLSLVFPWVGLNQAGDLANASVRVDDGSGTHLQMSTW